MKDKYSVKKHRGDSMAKVKLKEITEAMEAVHDDYSTYLNKKTGEVVTLSDYELRAAEEGKPLDEFPEWQKGNVIIAQEIFEDEDDNFIPLPSKFDIHEYRIMERFCLSIHDTELRENMYYSIKRKGAFRYFRDNIRRFKIEDDWYNYRENALKRIAIEWCERNGVPFIS